MSMKHSSYSYFKKNNLATKLRIAPVCVMTWLMLGYITPSSAEIIASQNQNSIPTIISNSNQSNTININTASPSGISHNKFTQFDVNQNGVILNNNAKDSTSTLAGKIPGNSNMVKGPASLIINEVISNNSSQLNGMIEVAGKKADVIISNPSGISCDGCGFINTGNGTLTTGNIKIQNDKLTNISVKKGEIIISGKGMNDKSDFTNLLANTVKVSAELRAKDLNINAGKTKARVGAEPGIVGIDISELGGMYANKITLVIDQEGPGINNKGLISATSDLNITTMGNISNSGKISTSSGGANIIAMDIDNTSGSISTVGDIFMIAADKLNNSQGVISSTKEIMVNGSTLDNTAGFISGNNVSLVANLIINQDSEIFGIKNKDITDINSKEKTSSGGIFAKGNIALNAGNLLNNNAGIIHSENGTVALASQQGINLDNADISANQINIYAEELQGKASGISSGKLLAKNDIVIEANNLGKFDHNTALDAGNNLTINSNGNEDSIQFINDGILKAGKKFSYEHSGSFVNAGEILSGNELIVKADTIENSNTISSVNKARLQASTSLTNVSGKISADEKLMMSAPEVLNIKGDLLSSNPIEIKSDKFENTGKSSEVTLSAYQTPYQ